MYRELRIVAIIPARGGSKGIPRKNVRLLVGKPLIAYAIESALASRYLDGVYVTTDDEEIGTVARRLGAALIERPAELAGDDVTLDPVIHHALVTIEAEGQPCHAVMTLQPTSPLIRAETLDRAIEHWHETGADTLISAIPNNHLFWIKGAQGFRPFYPERLNRQHLEPVMLETGSFVISRRGIVTPRSRIAGRIELFALPKEEGIDIDDLFDWWVAEHCLKRKRVVLRTDGHDLIGLGHVYRCLCLAERLTDYDVHFLMSENRRLGVELVRQRHHRVATFDGDVLSALEQLRPDIVINDILDTDAAYVKALKARGWCVINFEDLGPGAREADLVINALYASNGEPNVVGGPRYFCLRDEFYSLPRSRPVADGVKRLLLTFGGTDAAGLTLKVLSYLDRMGFAEEVDVITGFGYSHHGELGRLASKSSLNVRLNPNSKCISQYIHEADLMITSGGRTVYEAASLGTPCLVLCQNEREMTHHFAAEDNGVVNLGLGQDVTYEAFKAAFERLLERRMREDLSRRMARFDFRKGGEAVIGAIEAAYDRALGSSQ